MSCIAVEPYRRRARRLDGVGSGRRMCVHTEREEVISNGFADVIGVSELACGDVSVARGCRSVLEKMLSTAGRDFAVAHVHLACP